MEDNPRYYPMLTKLCHFLYLTPEARKTFVHQFERSYYDQNEPLTNDIQSCLKKTTQSDGTVVDEAVNTQGQYCLDIAGKKKITSFFQLTSTLQVNFDIFSITKKWNIVVLYKYKLNIYYDYFFLVLEHFDSEHGQCWLSSWFCSGKKSFCNLKLNNSTKNPYRWHSNLCDGCFVGQ